MPTLDTITTRLRTARLLGLGAFYLLTELRDEAETTAARLFAETARKHPSRLALLFEDQRFTYGEFDAYANRVGNAFLALGAKKGDVVALLMDNRPEYLATILGLNKIGVVTSLVNTHVSGTPLGHALRICGPRWVLAGDEHVSNLRDIAADLPVPAEAVMVWRERPEVAVEDFGPCFDGLVTKAPSTDPSSGIDVRVKDPMLYMYTSGTTGLPKAAVLKNQRFLRAAYTFGRILSGLEDGDITYITVPLYHATGAVAAFGSAVATGSAVALRRKFSASGFWDDVHRFGVTCFPYIGELCRYLLVAKAHPLERKHRLRVMMGAGLRADVWTPFVERFGVPRVIEFYASTEGNVAIVNLDQRPGMLGRLMPGQEVVKVDPATEEIARDSAGRLIRCAEGEQGMMLGRIDRINRFDGYLDSKKTSEKILLDAFGDGTDYFNTGDLVTLHPDRFVSFADRLGDTFRWKGENVSTTEVSMMLNECAGVVETNVYGVEVPGTDGRAGMVSLVAGEDFDLSRFAAHVVARLPKYARPVFLRVQRELQLTGSFKYVKTDLKKDGFDPSRISEPLYYFDLGSQGYLPIDAGVHQRIVRGEIAL